MRSRIHALGFVALAAVGTAVPALAQQPNAKGGTEYPACNHPVSNDDSEAAHKKYIAGKSAYDDSRWDVAIARFREAYQKDCTKHELLVILSRAYEFNHDFVEAIRALETYLDRVKDPPDEQTYRNRLKTLREKLAAQQSSASATTSSAPPAPPPTATTTAPPPPPPRGEMREHTALPWIVVTLGGAIAVTGIILLVAAPPLPPNCNASSNICNRTESTVNGVVVKESDSQLANDQDRAKTHQGLSTGGLVCIIGGVAIAGGGVLWHFLEPTGSQTGKPKVVPTVAPGYGGVALGGSF